MGIQYDGRVSGVFRNQEAQERTQPTWMSHLPPEKGKVSLAPLGLAQARLTED